MEKTMVFNNTNIDYCWINSVILQNTDRLFRLSQVHALANSVFPDYSLVYFISRNE